MSESESREVVDQETKLENNPRKRVRHRKKQLYENILKQMEFYFSDANLSKDRFLGDLVKSDPFVPIETFLKFNKIRSMTQDVTDIAKAMKHSTILELSDNRLKVRRKSPILPYDAEARTVYVESIPVTAGREWLERVFSDYGKVVYISLPKFKNSNKIKGYGFIEFDKSEEAQKCINEFTKMGCKLPTGMPPEDLSSIKMFSVENQSDIENKEVKEEYETPKKKAKKNKERKHKSLELKLDGESDNEIKKVGTPLEDKTLDSESKDEATSQDEEKEEKSPRKKKGRKRTAKDKNKTKNILPEAPKGALWGLQILSKCEWKKLRNKYLDLQRKYMKELKANYQNRRYTYSAIPAPAAAPLDVESDINPGDTDGPKDVTTLEQIPGVFVKEVLSELCLDVKLTKRTIRTNIHVQHVDVKEGQSEVIIRFDNSKAADEYCSGAGTRAHVLSGAEEEAQWARAVAARCNKRARGRARVLARAPPPAGPAPASPQPTHTHIRFDDE